MSHTQHLQALLQPKPGAELPKTHGWPALAKVEIETKVRLERSNARLQGSASHRPLDRARASVREQTLIQVLDFYREGTC